jgi:hypothetical protein
MFIKQQICDVEVFSDASYTGYGGFVSDDTDQNCSGSWTEFESEQSSMWRELQAVNRLLPKLLSAWRGVAFGGTWIILTLFIF